MDINTYHSEIYQQYLDTKDIQEPYIASLLKERADREVYLSDYMLDYLDDEDEEIEQHFIITAIYVPIDVVRVKIILREGSDKLFELNWYEGDEEPLELILKQAREIPPPEPVYRFKNTNLSNYKPIQICDPFIYVTNYHCLSIKYNTSCYDNSCHIEFRRYMDIAVFESYPYEKIERNNIVWGELKDSKDIIILRTKDELKTLYRKRKLDALLRQTKPEILK